MRRNAQPKICTVRVDRLCQLWDPISALDLNDVTFVDTVKEQPTYSLRRGPVYHKRRVQYFLGQLRRGFTLGALEVDVYDGELFVGDGNHRLVAMLLWGTVEVDVLFRGPVEVLRYLEGA